MAATKLSAFRFPPAVLLELDRRRGELTKTEFLTRLIMSDAPARSSLEERVQQLETAVFGATQEKGPDESGP